MGCMASATSIRDWFRGRKWRWSFVMRWPPIQTYPVYGSWLLPCALMRQPIIRSILNKCSNSKGLASRRLQLVGRNTRFGRGSAKARVRLDQFESVFDFPQRQQREDHNYENGTVYEQDAFFLRELKPKPVSVTGPVKLSSAWTKLGTYSVRNGKIIFDETGMWLDQGTEYRQ